MKKEDLGKYLSDLVDEAQDGLYTYDEFVDETISMVKEYLDAQAVENETIEIKTISPEESAASRERMMEKYKRTLFLLK